MHADNIDWADRMEAWKNNSENKRKSKAGDDRTPPWRWVGCLNYDDPKAGVVTIPSEYVMRCIMAGAAEVPTGKGQKTFKAQSQSGILCREFHWPLLVSGKTIPMGEICKLIEGDEDFKANSAVAEQFGFSLFVKRAKIGPSKHVRVRPRFDSWATGGDLLITDSQITDAILRDIFRIAGERKGLGDWRPGGTTPGPWGMFEATIS